jgi:hypothetical protein
MWSNASYFNFQYSVPFIRSCSYLHLLPRLSFTFILPSLFPSVTCLKRQLLCKVWPIQAVLLRPIAWCSLFLSPLTVCNDTSVFTRWVHMTFSILLQHQIVKFLCIFNLLSKMCLVPMLYKVMRQTQHFISLFLRYESNQSCQHGVPNTRSI